MCVVEASILRSYTAYNKIIIRRYSYHRVISTYYMERQLPYIMTWLLLKITIDECSHLIIKFGDAVSQSSCVIELTKITCHGERTLNKRVKDLHAF